MATPLELVVVPGSYAVCRLPPGTPWPTCLSGAFVSVSWTEDETSVVCEEAVVPEGVRREGGWKCLRVAGRLDFALIGVLASLLVPLAEATICVFVVSTFDTDYLLVKGADLDRAIAALVEAGHTVNHGAGCGRNPDTQPAAGRGAQ